jgi:molybdate transport repressor ModE-like protein
MIDIQRLHVLRAVARHGSFARAAAELRFTPSAVSQQIAALERAVGQPVVERSTRGVRLTEAGEILAATADAVAAEVRLAEEALAALATGQVGRLRVATFPTASQRLLPPALAQLVREQPGAEMRVLEAEPGEALQRLRAGEVDVAVVYRFPEMSAGPAGLRDPDLTWTTIVDDPLYVVLPATHRLAGRPVVSLADLADDSWVQGWSDCGEVLDLLAAAAGFVPKVSCTSSDYQFMQSLVAAGIGLALVPETGLARDLEGLAVASTYGVRPFRRISAVTATRRRRSPFVDRLIELLGEVSAPSRRAG